MKKIPDKTTILEWILENPTQNTKRDIARAFGLKGAGKIDLKRILKELSSEGLLSTRKKNHNNVKILGSTENVGPPKNIVHGDGPIAIQEHCCTKVSFRNIWVREIQ